MGERLLNQEMTMVAAIEKSRFTLGNIRHASVDEAIRMVRHNLENFDETVVRMLRLLYARQTSDEQASEATRHKNSVGFNGADGRILASFAKQVERWLQTPVGRREYGFPLSPRQIARCRQLLPKYARQIVQIIRSKAD